MITLNIDSSAHYSFQDIQALYDFIIDNGMITEVGFVSEEDLTLDQKNDLEEVRSQDITSFRSI